MEAGAIVMNVETFKPTVARHLQVYKVIKLNSNGKAVVVLEKFPLTMVHAFDVSVLCVKQGEFWMPPSRKRRATEISEGS